MVAAFATEPADWAKLLSARASALSTCALPAGLENRRLEQLPKERLVAVFRTPNAATADGCGISVYSSEDKQRIYVSVGGGLANHIHFHLGPFRYDGSDF
jgi:hypothetical protein